MNQKDDLLESTIQSDSKLFEMFFDHDLSTDEFKKNIDKLKDNEFFIYAEKLIKTLEQQKFHHSSFQQSKAFINICINNASVELTRMLYLRRTILSALCNAHTAYHSTKIKEIQATPNLLYDKEVEDFLNYCKSSSHRICASYAVDNTLMSGFVRSELAISHLGAMFQTIVMLRDALMELRVQPDAILWNIAMIVRGEYLLSYKIYNKAKTNMPCDSIPSHVIAMNIQFMINYLCYLGIEDELCLQVYLLSQEILKDNQDNAVLIDKFVFEDREDKAVFVNEEQYDCRILLGCLLQVCIQKMVDVEVIGASSENIQLECEQLNKHNTKWQNLLQAYEIEANQAMVEELRASYADESLISLLDSLNGYSRNTRNIYTPYLNMMAEFLSSPDLILQIDISNGAVQNILIQIANRTSAVGAVPACFLYQKLFLHYERREHVEVRKVLELIFHHHNMSPIKLRRYSGCAELNTIFTDTVTRLQDAGLIVRKEQYQDFYTHSHNIFKNLFPSPLPQIDIDLLSDPVNSVVSKTLILNFKNILHASKEVQIYLASPLCVAMSMGYDFSYPQIFTTLKDERVINFITHPQHQVYIDRINRYSRLTIAGIRKLDPDRIRKFVVTYSKHEIVMKDIHFTEAVELFSGCNECFNILNSFIARYNKYFQGSFSDIRKRFGNANDINIYNTMNVWSLLQHLVHGSVIPLEECMELVKKRYKDLQKISLLYKSVDKKLQSNILYMFGTDRDKAIGFLVNFCALPIRRMQGVGFNVANVFSVTNRYLNTFQLRNLSALLRVLLNYEIPDQDKRDFQRIITHYLNIVQNKSISVKQVNRVIYYISRFRYGCSLYVHQDILDLLTACRDLRVVRLFEYIEANKLNIDLIGLHKLIIKDPRCVDRFWDMMSHGDGRLFFYTYITQHTLEEFHSILQAEVMLNTSYITYIDEPLYDDCSRPPRLLMDYNVQAAYFQGQLSKFPIYSADSLNHLKEVSFEQEDMIALSSFLKVIAVSPIVEHRQIIAALCNVYQYSSCEKFRVLISEDIAKAILGGMCWTDVLALASQIEKSRDI